jgi:phenylalanyl-tRNA synthetase beta chain
LLEGAFWNPAVIQGKSRRLGFTSDAGYRFERGVDFEGCARAVERATQLILDCCGGRAGPLSDVIGVLPARTPIRVRPARVTRLLGIALSDATMAALFRALGFTFTHVGEEFLITPPSYRFDLAIEEDFVEEIARLYGFDAIPATVSAQPPAMLPQPEAIRPAIAVKRVLVARGWQEAITFSFVSSAWESTLFPARDANAMPIRVRNPIAAHLDVMRTTLAGGLIDVLRTNLSRKRERLRVFEAGRCFWRAAQGYEQPQRLGGLAYGDALPEQWGCPARPVDLFDVRSDLAGLVAPRTLTTERAEHPLLHPGRSARVRVDAIDVGLAWRVAPAHRQGVRASARPRPVRARPRHVIDRWPAHSPSGVAFAGRPARPRRRPRRGIPAQEVVSALEAAKPSHVEAIRLFDVYRGRGIDLGQKSLAILVLMQDTERTLTDAEIDATMAELLRILVVRFGATLRQ